MPVPSSSAPSAEACGAEEFRCAQPKDVRPAISALLHSPQGAVLEVAVDADEKPSLPEELKV